MILLDLDLFFSKIAELLTEIGKNILVDDCNKLNRKTQILKLNKSFQTEN